jgi:hypothetical protein
MTLLRIGVRLTGKRNEKVPAALARGETGTRSHLCRETLENSVPWAQLEHTNPDADLSHSRTYILGEDETFTRARENGGRKTKIQLDKWFCHPHNWKLRL